LTTHLLIIDPQVDFMDLAGSALPVEGASADMERLAAFIDANGSHLDRITVTLDTHELHDIGHPVFWRKADGTMPAPFTPVSVEDVEQGRIDAAEAGHRDYVRRYLRALKAGKRYGHMIWPVHCQIGSPGHAIHPAVLRALNAWETRSGVPARRVLKGQNRLTEHYSAVRAEVVDPRDPATATNRDLVASVVESGRVLVAGEALSHCVKATVEDLVDEMPPGKRASGFTLLTDAMSPVSGFEAQGQAFLERMSQQGATLRTLAQVSR
jgi:nicotinamidase-related amidase